MRVSRVNFYVNICNMKEHSWCRFLQGYFPKMMLVLFFTAALYFYALPSAVSNIHAAYFYLDPVTQVVEEGENLTVDIKINSEGEAPVTADLFLLFDAGIFSFVGIEEGEMDDYFFPKIYERVSRNKIYIGASIELSGGEAVSGEGIVARLIFKGVSEGQSDMAFMCTEGSTVDSNVSLKKNGKVTDD